MMMRQNRFIGGSIPELRSSAHVMAEWFSRKNGLQKIRVLPETLIPYFPEELMKEGLPENRVLFENRIYLHQLTAGNRELLPLFQQNADNPGCPVLWGQTLTAVIGRGSSAAVYLTASGCALKVSGNRNVLRKEYELLCRLKNPNTVQALDYFESPSGAAILEEKLISAQGTMEGYSVGLNFLHSHGICHGDIRRSNLARSVTGIAKWIDLGKAFQANASEQEQENQTLQLLFTHTTGVL